jgi:DNA-binding CsgD family transcriptional regulator
MAQPPPAYDDSHLPPLGEGTVEEIRKAAGIQDAKGPVMGRRQTQLNARELRALELTAAGATYDLIAKILSITRPNARLLVERALARRAAEVGSREHHVAKALALDQMEHLWRRWYPLAMGDPANGIPPSKDAAGIALRIHERICRIQGLDAPVQVDARVEVEVNAETPEQRREKILASLAETRARQQAIEGEWREAA